MEAYVLMLEANFLLISGCALSEEEKQSTISSLLAARNTVEEIRSYHTTFRCPGNIDSEGRRMYPEFYVLLLNEGKKPRIIFGQRAATHILSGNLYELEILRLLFLLAPDDSEVQAMVSASLERLKTTCFGSKGCSTGECFESTLVALRFLATVTPSDTEWMQHLVKLYLDHAADRKRSPAVVWYFWLCLTELPLQIAEPALHKYAFTMQGKLNTQKRSGWRSEEGKKTSIMLLCTLRRALSSMPDEPVSSYNYQLVLNTALQ